MNVHHRLACQRPHASRIIHAVSLEISSIALTLPIVLTLGGHGVFDALAINLGLTAFYTGYAYVFYLAYDRIWPIEKSA